MIQFLLTKCHNSNCEHIIQHLDFDLWPNMEEDLMIFGPALIISFILLGIAHKRGWLEI